MSPPCASTQARATCAGVHPCARRCVRGVASSRLRDVLALEARVLMPPVVRAPSSRPDAAVGNRVRAGCRKRTDTELAAGSSPRLPARAPTASIRSAARRPDARRARGDRRRRCFRQADARTLPVTSRPSRPPLLDRHQGIHAMLVMQVDALDAQALQARVAHPADGRRRAVGPAHRPRRRSPPGTRTWWPPPVLAPHLAQGTGRTVIRRRRARRSPRCRGLPAQLDALRAGRAGIVGFAGSHRRRNDMPMQPRPMAETSRPETLPGAVGARSSRLAIGTHRNLPSSSSYPEAHACRLPSAMDNPSRWHCLRAAGSGPRDPRTARRRRNGRRLSRA